MPRYPVLCARDAWVRSEEVRFFSSVLGIEREIGLIGGRVQVRLDEGDERIGRYLRGDAQISRNFSV